MSKVPKILIVEDVMSFRMNGVRALKRLRLEVLEAESLEAARNIIQNTPDITAVITDLNYCEHAGTLDGRTTDIKLRQALFDLHKGSYDFYQKHPEWIEQVSGGSRLYLDRPFKTSEGRDVFSLDIGPLGIVLWKECRAKNLPVIILTEPGHARINLPALVNEGVIPADELLTMFTALEQHRKQRTKRSHWLERAGVPEPWDMLMSIDQFVSANQFVIFSDYDKTEPFWIRACCEALLQQQNQSSE